MFSYKLLILNLFFKLFKLLCKRNSGPASSCAPGFLKLQASQLQILILHDLTIQMATIVIGVISCFGNDCIHIFIYTQLELEYW